MSPRTRLLVKRSFATRSHYQVTSYSLLRGAVEVVNLPPKCLRSSSNILGVEHAPDVKLVERLLVELNISRCRLRLLVFWYQATGLFCCFPFLYY